MIRPCKVSVVIPCFNHGEFLPEAVHSVTGINRDDIELIVVDDGSTEDQTRREMESLVAQGIHVISQENRGLAAARNAGILASCGEYILPLDADNHLRGGYIEHGIRILDANPEIGVVYGDAEYIGERTGRWKIGRLDLDRLLQGNQVDACAMYRRCIWEQNKGYDGGMPVQGYEDWDFWLGALENGWRFAYVPEVLFDYRVARGSMSMRARVFGGEVERFVALKHASLYGEAFRRLANQQESLMWNFRNLARLFRSRLKRSLSQHAGF